MGVINGDTRSLDNGSYAGWLAAKEGKPSVLKLVEDLR